MRNLLFIILTLCIYLSAYSQDRPYDAYLAEEQGYYINIKPVLNGYIFTDNYCNSLYYLSNGQVETLISTPGCGRYFTVSPDGSKIGFKYISKTGQTSAIISLIDKEMQFLAEESSMCGQVGFTDNSVYYTQGEWLNADISVDSSFRIKLGNYSNIAAVSENHDQFVFSSTNDELILLTVETFEKTVISETGKMSVYPKFSPDNKKIMYQSGNIFVYEIENGKTYDLGEGLAPKWAPDSESVVFTKQTVENQTLTSSDIYTCNYKDTVHHQLTNSSDIHEMQPIYTSENEIIYNTYTSRKIIKLNLTTNTVHEIASLDAPEIQFFELSSTKSEDLIPGTVPYTHQVYDTQDSHYGYGSCAPACAIMAISYYNIIPKWPMDVTKLFPHSSDYGAYVSQRYRMNEHYFEESENTSGGDLAYGGYGYMWGLGSPNSQMRNYMAEHYMESSQLWSSSVTWEGVLAEIDADYPLPVCAMLSSAGHLVLAKGYINDQHTLIFSEPYGDKNTPSWPSYDGQKAYYDWPGYNNGYQNLDFDGSYGIIAWTVTTHTTEATYNDTIIDDVFYNHGFEVNNSEDGSTQRYYRDINGGYNGHFWYTITEASSTDICWVEWSPTVDNDGYYNISAYIPATNATAENAPYKITDADLEHTVEINQGDYSDEWVSLGVYQYEDGSEFKVHLGDGTGTDGQDVAFDAVKFDFIPTPIAAFTTSDQDFCIGENIVFTNSSSNADDYEWTFLGASITSSTDINPNITYPNAGTFDISLTANGSMESDLLEQSSYITIHEAPIADFTLNSDELYLPEAVVIFSNQSTNAEIYYWSFGDGSNSADSNPYHEYTSVGNYTVSLTASNPWCDDDVFEYGSDVVVLNPTGIDTDNSNFITIHPNPAVDYIFVKCIEQINSIKIFDATGRIVLNENYLEAKIDISNLPSGNYLIELTTDNESYTGKFVK